MRELKQDWRDIFGSFRVAFDVWKLLLAFVGVGLTGVVLWGLLNIPTSAVADPAGWIIALVIGSLLLVGLVVKFATSDTGFTLYKALMLLAVAVVLAGAVLLCVFTDTARVWGRCGGITLVVLAIWAFFGGAVTRIASVEIASDDRVGLGEAAKYACRKYGAYLGATLLPVIAVLVLALCCALFGLVFRVPVVNIIVTALFFFLVPLAGFLMFLIGLGGVAGAPLMYPAVSTEGNDSFDAISRAYSYVFGRPWRYVAYNAVGAAYGAVCSFFVAIFVTKMLGWSLAAVNYGTNDHYRADIHPRVMALLNPLVSRVAGVFDGIAACVLRYDVTGYLTKAYAIARGAATQGAGLSQNVVAAPAEGGTYAASAVIMAIILYVVIGLVVAYIVSLFFSIQTNIYLLLRKSVDGAEMTEVYREEEEEDYLAVTPEGDDQPAEAIPAEPAVEAKPAKKKAAKKKATKKKDEESSE